MCAKCQVSITSIITIIFPFKTTELENIRVMIRSQIQLQTAANAETQNIVIPFQTPLLRVKRTRKKGFATVETQ